MEKLLVYQLGLKHSDSSYNTISSLHDILCKMHVATAYEIVHVFVLVLRYSMFKLQKCSAFDSDKMHAWLMLACF